MNWVVVRRLIWKKECFSAPVNGLPNIERGEERGKDELGCSKKINMEERVFSCTSQWFTQHWGGGGGEEGSGEKRGKDKLGCSKKVNMEERLFSCTS